MSKIGKHATTITKEKDVLKVIYHSTTIYSENLRSGEITLNSGGYRTYTTKKRINQAFQEFNKPLKLSQKNFRWVITVLPTGKEIEFKDGLKIQG